MDFGLKAGKIGGAKCIEVKWNKVETGACYVKYEVVLKSASESNVYGKTGYNIGVKSTSRNVTAKVSNTPLHTATPSPPGMTPLCTLFFYF